MVGPAIEVRCEAPEMLELVEAVLDAVARLVDRRVVWDRDFARSGRRNDRDHAGVRDQLAQLVAVLGFVGCGAVRGRGCLIAHGVQAEVLA